MTEVNPRDVEEAQQAIANVNSLSDRTKKLLTDAILVCCDSSLELRAATGTVLRLKDSNADIELVDGFFDKLRELAASLEDQLEQKKEASKLASEINLDECAHKVSTLMDDQITLRSEHGDELRKSGDNLVVQQSVHEFDISLQLDGLKKDNTNNLLPKQLVLQDKISALKNELALLEAQQKENNSKISKNDAEIKRLQTEHEDLKKIRAERKQNKADQEANTKHIEALVLHKQQCIEAINTLKELTAELTPEKLHTRNKVFSDKLAQYKAGLENATRAAAAIRDQVNKEANDPNYFDKAQAMENQSYETHEMDCGFHVRAFDRITEHKRDLPSFSDPIPDEVIVPKPLSPSLESILDGVLVIEKAPKKDPLPTIGR